MRGSKLWKNIYLDFNSLQNSVIIKMMKLGNILDKMKGSRNPAWLFLSYDLDNSRITAVRL